MKDFIFPPNWFFIYTFLPQFFLCLPSPPQLFKILPHSLDIRMALKCVPFSPLPLSLHQSWPSSELPWTEHPFSNPSASRLNFPICSPSSSQNGLPTLVLDHVILLLKHLQWLPIAYPINLKLPEWSTLSGPVPPSSGPSLAILCSSPYLLLMPHFL